MLRAAFRLTAVLLPLCFAATASAEPLRISLVSEVLRPGAVPRLAVGARETERYLAIYARTAGGRVVALPWFDRSRGGPADPVLRLASGAELAFWVGKSAGYFVAPRRGLERDREALIVLVASEEIAGMGALAPAAGIVPDEAAPLAGGFYRALSASGWAHRVEIHILPYGITREGEASSQGGGASELLRLRYETWNLREALTVADILSIEIGETHGPLRIVSVGGLPEIHFTVDLPAERDALAVKLGAVFRDLAIPAGEPRDGLQSRD